MPLGLISRYLDDPLQEAPEEETPQLIRRYIPTLGERAAGLGYRAVQGAAQAVGGTIEAAGQLVEKTGAKGLGGQDIGKGIETIGQWLSTSAEGLKPKKEAASEGLAGDVASGIGSSAGFLATTLAGAGPLNLAGIAPKTATLIAGLASGIGGNFAGGYMDALESTANKDAAAWAAEQVRAAGGGKHEAALAYGNVLRDTGNKELAFQAGLLNGILVGPTEMMGLGAPGRLAKILAHAERTTGGAIGTAIAKTMLEESAQEGLGQFVQNLGAHFLKYDEDRKVWEGVAKNALVGGLAGVVLGGPLEVAANLAGKAPGAPQETGGALATTEPSEAPIVAPEAEPDAGQEESTETPQVATPPIESGTTITALQETASPGQPSAPEVPTSTSEVVGSSRAAQPEQTAQGEAQAGPSVTIQEALITPTRGGVAATPIGEQSEPSPVERHGLGLAVETALAGNVDIGTAKKARAYAEGLGFKPDDKTLDEAVEVGVVSRARKIVREGREAGTSDEETFDRLLDVYQKQPKLQSRTSTSKELQAYSTPVPLSFAAAKLAGIEEDTTVYEPTAGNGSLLITAGTGPTQANELDPARASSLEALGFHPTIEDALSPNHQPRTRVDAVIANPPFGKVLDEQGKHRTFPAGEGKFIYRTKEIDHAIAFKTLSAMKDDGRAVLIIGGKKPFGDPSQAARTKGYRALTQQEFFKALYSTYNVADHFTVDGKLYDRQGAAWPIDVIVIHGRRVKGQQGDSRIAPPYQEAPRVLGSWGAVRDLLRGRLVPTGVEPEGDRSAGTALVAPERGDAESSGLRTPAPDTSVREDAEPRGGGDEGTAPGDVRVPRTDRPRRNRPAAQTSDGGVAGVPGSGQPVGPVVGGPERVADEGGPEERPASTESAGERGAEGVASPDDAAPSRGLERVNQFQASYRPQSKSDAIGTLVPANMQAAMDRSLERVAKQSGGDIDTFVAEKLGYSPDELKRYFAAEQVDALALAISNLDKGAGFVIGDQTGVGKGRVVAAILRYAKQRGKIPVFVTAKPALYADMRRDLTDIGMPKFRQFVTNTNLTGERKLPLRSGEMIESLGKAEYEKAMQGFAKAAQEGRGHPEYDAIFTTYDQMNPQGGEETARNSFMRSIAKNAILVLDESHKAGGTEQKGFFKDREGNPIVKANRADFFRDIVDAAVGVVYSSATYAKNPHVMSIYTRTDMGLAVDDRSKLPELVSSGGVPLQQVIATMLVETGQYVRREKSFEGIEMKLDVAKTARAAADTATGHLRDLFQFDLQMVEARKKFAQSTAGGGGGILAGDSAVGQGGASSGGFSSVMHNVIAQMLLSLKAREVGRNAVETFRAGKKPVIALANTMESLLNAEGLAAGAELKDYTFSKVFTRYLERTRHVVIKEAFSKGKADRHYITDEELIQLGFGHLLQQFEALRDQIDGSDLGDMPAAPIDAIIEEMERGGMKVGEITGRKLRVQYQPDGSAVLVQREDSQAAKARSMRQFNDGELDALIINQSGAEGFSLHASPKNGRDVRPRHMFVVQADPNIDVFMQLLGRINRTGQTELPGYTVLVSDLPSEKRPAAILMKKMASLNANTSASRESAVSLKNVTDFMNVYGDQAVAEVLRSEPELAASIGFDEEVIADELKNDNLAHRATGYLPLLPVEDQERLLEAIETNYAMRLEEAKALGENLLEAEAQDLKAKVISSTELVPGKGRSPFTRPAMIEDVEASRTTKPLTWEIVQSRARKLAGADEGADLEGARRAAASRMRAQVDAALTEQRERGQAEYAKLKSQLPEGAPDDHPLRERMGAVQKRFTKAALMAEAINERIALLERPGVEIKTSTDTSAAYVVGIEAPKKGNALAPSNWSVVLAPADADRTMRVAVSRLMAAGLPEEEGYLALGPLRTPISPDDFAGKATERRERRWIITGNLLAGFAKMGRHGQIGFYTTDKGALNQGIILKRGTNPQEILAAQPVRLSGAQAVEFVDKTGGYAANKEDTFRISSRGPGFPITLSAKARGGKPFFLHQEARRVLGADYESRRGEKEWELSTMDRKAVKKALAIYERDLGLELQTTEAMDMAREVTGQKLPELVTPGITTMHAGPPLAIGAIPMAGVRAFFRKHLRWHAGAPREAGRALELARGMVEAEMSEVAERARELDRAAGKLYRGGWRAKPIAMKIDAAFRDPDKLAELPEVLQRPLAAMRMHVDRMTRLMLQVGAVDPESKLAEIMLGNLGTYLKREYKAFNDVAWVDKVSDQVKQRFVSMLVSEGKSEEDAHGIMEAILEEAKESAANPFRQIASSKLGHKDLSIFKKRKDVPEELRALLGEIKDPLANYANSVMRMAGVVARHKAYTKIRAEGLQSGWLSEPGSRERGHSATISKEGNPALGPLDGMHTTPEIKEALTAIKPGEVAEWMRVVMLANSFIKWGKVIGQPTAFVRNLASNVTLSLSNGHVPMWTSLEAWKHAFSRGSLDERKRLLRLGVIGNAIGVYEFEDYRNSLKQTPEELAKAQAGIYEKLKGSAEQLYQAADNLPKIMGFYVEEAGLIKAGLAPARAEELAADRIRDLYPTPERMAQAAKAYRRQPFLGQYFAFRAELVRTFAHRLKLIKKELSSGNKTVRAMGYKRVAGSLFAASLTPAAVLAWNMLNGIDADEDKDRRKFVPPWDEKNELVWLGDETQGQYLDPSDIDPVATFTDPIMRVAVGGDPWEQALRDWLKENGLVFFGPSPVSTLAVELYSGETKAGRPIDSWAGHVWKSVQPGIVSWYARETEAGFGPGSLASFAVARAYNFDVEKSLQYDVRGFARAVSEATSKANRLIRADPAHVDDARSEQEASRRAAFADMTEKIRAASRLGVDPKKLWKLLDDELSSEVAHAILVGVYVPYRPKPVPALQTSP